MATFDLTQAKVTVDLRDPDFVNFGSFVSGTPNFWDWLSVLGHRLDVIGGGMTYSGGRAITGTVSAIGFDLNNDAVNATELAITGLNVAAATLDDSADSFWRILDGNDTINGPLKANITADATSYIFGDGLNARNGATGGNDIFDLGDTNITAFGDVVNVGSQSAGAAAVTYTGGDDTLNGRDTDKRQTIFGDAQSVYASGRLNGGDDKIFLRAAVIFPEATGDAGSVEGVSGNLAELFGGDDQLDATGMLTSISNFGASMTGDVFSVGPFASFTGGTDTLFGSAFNDNLTGDAGNNSSTVIGGNDTFYGNDGEDNIVGEVFNASGTIIGGDDTMYGGANDDRMFGEIANDLGVILIGGNDKMYGEAGLDFMRGQSGNDILDGGIDVDTMEGGTGNDSFFVDNLLDKARELVGEGTADRVYASSNYALEAGQEIEILTTTNSGLTGAINLSGNEFANNIVGNNGANIIDGAAGIDRMTGLLGIDQYFVDNALDVVNEAANGGTADRVYASVSYALGADQQIEIFTTTNSAGVGALNLTGNNVANTIVGNNGANILDGGAGIDRLTGLLGNDLYYVDNFADVVVEAAGGGTADRVLTSVNYVLADNQQIELFSTTNSAGVSAINLVGNNLANRILGNNGANVINGGLANDVLTGGLGADQFRFSTAIAGGGNVDTIADFTHLTDDMQLAQGIFINIGGTLDAAEFKLGTAATTTAQRIIYDGVTGSLFFDADGTGAGAQVQFAKVTAGTVLDINDFIMI